MPRSFGRGRGWLIAGAVVVSLGFAEGASAQSDPGGGERPWYTFEDWSLERNTLLRVNVANGNLLLRTREYASEPVRGPDLTWDRYFNSVSSRTGYPNSLGAGGTAPLSQDVQIVPLADGRRMLYPGDGAQYVYSRSVDGAWRSPGVDAVMRDQADGSTTVDHPEADELQRFRNGRLVSVEDAVGDKLTLSYTGGGFLSGIQDADGRRLAVDNDDSFLAYFRPPDATRWSYAYAAGGVLDWVEVGGVRTVDYNEDLAGRVTAIRPVGGPATTISYDSAGRVSTVAAQGGAPVTFSYGAPSAPCDPATDVGRTVVSGTGQLPRTYCWNARWQVTSTDPSFTDDRDELPPGEEEVDTPEDPDPDPGDDYLCEPDLETGETYCGEDPPSPEDDGFAPLATNVRFGIGDANFILRENGSTFNLFANRAYQALDMPLVRRIVPWNIALAHQHDDTEDYFYNDVAEWVRQAFAAGKRPIISFERCRDEFTRTDIAGSPLTNPDGSHQRALCHDVGDEEVAPPPANRGVQPTLAEYHAAMIAFLEDPVLGRVNDFTAWNEPNNLSFDGTRVSYQPTHDARLTGRYWRKLWALCRRSAYNCRVAAGDFADSNMANVRRAASRGGTYFRQYRRGMGNARPDYWAWHSYSDGADALTLPAENRWRRFRRFRDQTRSRRAGVPSPDIWLTEQGAVRERRGRPTRIVDPMDPAQTARNAKAVTARLTSDEANGLLESSARITRFLYYQMRGDSPGTGWDSGLLSPVNNSRRGNYWTYWCRQAPHTSAKRCR